MALPVVPNCKYETIESFSCWLIVFVGLLCFVEYASLSRHQQTQSQFRSSLFVKSKISWLTGNEKWDNTERLEWLIRCTSRQFHRMVSRKKDDSKKRTVRRDSYCASTVVFRLAQRPFFFSLFACFACRCCVFLNMIIRDRWEIVKHIHTWSWTTGVLSYQPGLAVHLIPFFSSSSLTKKKIESFVSYRSIHGGKRLFFHSFWNLNFVLVFYKVRVLPPATFLLDRGTYHKVTTMRIPRAAIPSSNQPTTIGSGTRKTSDYQSLKDPINRKSQQQTSLLRLG